MMRFSLITFFIWIIGLSFTLAQENDSLLRKINNYPYQDSLKVNLLNTYGWSVINNSPDSSLAVFNKARDLSEKLNWTIGRAKSLGNIGVAYYYLGNYPMALKNYLAALTIWEENKSLKNMATLYGNIGIINGLQKEYTDAEKYYLKAIAIAEKLNDKAACAQHYGNLGMILSYQGKSKEALIYHNKALKKDEELADSVGIGADLGNIGSVYLSQNNYAKALDFFNKALAISKNMGDKSQTAIWYANIGSVNFKQNNFIEAEKYLKDALQLDQEIASLEGQIEDHKSLYDLYEKINNPEAALFHYKSYTHLKDSVYSEENTKNLVKAGMNFEFEKKETISRAKQERQRLIIYSIGAIAVLLILLVFFVYNRYKIIQKQKEIIEQQKKEVEHQREIVLEEKKISEERKQEILDSIHYASRIQQAMLTSTDYITKHLACDYFILYLPKDIVAGDFYWAIKQHNLFYIITADCTGHGVPGAFMSLLNIGFLNELVIERNLKMPCDILNEQRKQIIHALNPKGNENSKDGMDCVLSAFDLENNKLYFSAANNPLCLVRNNELIDYKAQKIPVGKSERENESFALTEINLQKEDIIYTFTDGFPDQFGTNGKKFMSKKLKNLLIQINQLPMEAQKEQLLQAFHNHKGNEEQTDDILVIGVRV